MKAFIFDCNYSFIYASYYTICLYSYFILLMTELIFLTPFFNFSFISIWSLQFWQILGAFYRYCCSKFLFEVIFLPKGNILPPDLMLIISDMIYSWSPQCSLILFLFFLTKRRRLILRLEGWLNTWEGYGLGYKFLFHRTPSSWPAERQLRRDEFLLDPTMKGISSYFSRRSVSLMEWRELILLNFRSTLPLRCSGICFC